jgi:predicted phosphodiesterase
MRVFIFSDIHANIFPVRQLEKRLTRLDDAWCLGDFTGRGPHLKDVIQFWRAFNERSEMWVNGNHDAYLWRLLTPGQESCFKWKPREVLNCQRVSLNNLDDQLRDIVTAERSQMRWYKDTHYAIVHACAEDPLGINNSYFFPENWTPALLTRKNLVDPFARLALKEKGFEEAVLFYAHSHVPMFANLPPDKTTLNFLDFEYGQAIPIPAGITVVNPGSLGNPRMGSNTYVVLDLEKCTVTFEAFQLSENCIKMLMMDLEGCGTPAEIKNSFLYNSEEYTVKAKYHALYEKIRYREMKYASHLALTDDDDCV